MGWRELHGWIGYLNRQRERERPQPDSWGGGSEANFAELRAKREQLRGR